MVVRPNSSSTPSLPSRRAIFLGVQGAILFTALGLFIILWWKAPADLATVWEAARAKYLVLILASVALDYLIGGWRYRLFFDGRALPWVSLWNCMRSNWANMFLGAVTPGQTGGGPAQLYILWRCGAKISQGALVSLINFAATLLFFLLGSIAAWLFLPSNLWGENFAPIMKTGLLAVSAIIGLVLLILIFPAAGVNLISALFKAVPFPVSKLQGWRDRVLEYLNSELVEFRTSLKNIFREKKWAVAATVLATLVLYFNKYLMAYIILNGLGQTAPLGTFMGLQVMQYLLIYFAPTPGASGVAEISTGWLLEKIMAPQTIIYYAIVWRFFTTFLGAIFGGFVLFIDLHSWVKKARPQDLA